MSSGKQEKKYLKKQKKKAKRELSELKLILKRARKRGADAHDVEKAQELGGKLKVSLKEKSAEEIKARMSELEDFLDQRLARYRPNQAWEVIKGVTIAIAVAMLIRWMFVETFRIPSGSMIPTLLIGDQLVVNKLAFGPSIWVPYVDPPLTKEGVKEMLAEGSARFSFDFAGHNVVVVSKKLWLRRLPYRGEVIVFLYPRDPRHAGEPHESYIKRVIGLPGDVIKVEDGKLHINGKVQETEKAGDYEGPTGMSAQADFDLYIETLTSREGPVEHKILHRDSEFSSNPHWDYGPEKVPEGMIFVMGDNRDCSSDSRSWGYVPLSHIKGSALFIHLPLDPDNYYLPRWGRFFKSIN